MPLLAHCEDDTLTNAIALRCSSVGRRGHTDSLARVEAPVPERGYRGRSRQVHSEHAKLSTDPSGSDILRLMAAAGQRVASLAPIPRPRLPHPEIADSCC